MSEELSPSPEELRYKHAEHAATVKFLGDLAAKQGESDFYNDEENVHHRQRLVPGYTTKLGYEYNTTAPAGAQTHLEKAKADAQQVLDVSDAQAGKIVSENLDKIVPAARIDMTKDVLKQHQRNLQEVENYASTKEMWPEQHAAALQRSEEYVERHADVLGNQARAA